MKLNNTQLELLYPIVIRESQENPHPQWDALLETLTQLCVERGMHQLIRQTIPKHETIPTTQDETCDYCGYLDWTLEKYGRVTHKQACPHRTQPWHQTDPHPERMRGRG